MTMRNDRLSEAQWLSSDDSYKMLRSCRRYVHEHPRKARLFAVACCERIKHRMADKRSRAAVDVAARYADGLVGEYRLLVAGNAARAAHEQAFKQSDKLGACPEWAAEFALDPQPFFAATRASDFARVASRDPDESGPERAAQAELLRDIVGNPFHRPTINPGWLVPKVRKVAQKIYDTGAFERLPELADLLVAAECGDPGLLSHCRSDGPHVRGCWVVDLVLGKQ